MQLKNVRHFLFYIFVDHDIVRISWGNLLCVHFPFIVDILLKMSFCSFQWPTTCRSFWREASFRLYANSWETHRASGMENEKNCLLGLFVNRCIFFHSLFFQVNCAKTGNLCVEHTRTMSIAYGPQFSIDETHMFNCLWSPILYWWNSYVQNSAAVYALKAMARIGVLCYVG